MCILASRLTVKSTEVGVFFFASKYEIWRRDKFVNVRVRGKFFYLCTLLGDGEPESAWLTKFLDPQIL